MKPEVIISVPLKLRVYGGGGGLRVVCRLRAVALPSRHRQFTDANFYVLGTTDECSLTYKLGRVVYAAWEVVAGDSWRSPRPFKDPLPPLILLQLEINCSWRRLNSKPKALLPSTRDLSRARYSGEKLRASRAGFRV